jgi:hypothetical protein
VASAALTVLGLIGAVLMAVEAAGLYQLQPLEREDMWLGLRAPAFSRFIRFAR